MHNIKVLPQLESESLVGVAQLNFVGIHSWGQLHQKMVLQVLPHQQILSRFWRQTVPQVVGLLQRQNLMIIQQPSHFLSSDPTHITHVV